jgi:hypothetical protein
MTEKPVPYSAHPIEKMILAVRGQKAILDADLARLHGVSTSRLNEQVKRNRERFPADFAFRLTLRELRHLGTQARRSGGAGNLSQIATGSQKHRDPRKLPRVFTEHGAIMAANVLNSPEAVAMSVFGVRAFVHMRQDILGRAEMEKRLLEVERVLIFHDRKIRNLFERIRPLLLPPPGPEEKRIGFDVRERRSGYRIGKKR